MKKNYVLPIVLMLALALSRWPGVMPANFSAVYAIMFCAGVYFPGRLAWVLPMATMLVADILLSLFAYPNDQTSVRSFIVAVAPNYIGYFILILLGRGFGSKRSWATLVAGGLLGAFLFYIVANVAAWLSMPQYPKTLQGLIQALTTGLPGYPPTWTFLRNSLMSSGLFSGLFIGAIKLLEPSESAEEKREPVPEAEPEPEEAKS